MGARVSLMNFRKCRLFSTAFVALGFVGLIAASEARAQSTLRALGDAMNEEYREIKKLGPAATPAQISEVRRRVYKPVIVKGYDEGLRTFRNERWKIDKILGELREKMFPHIYKKGGAKGVVPTAAGGAKSSVPGTAGGAGAPPSGASAAPASDRGQANTSDGADGARDVQFGGKRKKEAPVNVIDGIIQ